jgi:alpha-galactosidase
MRAAWFLVAGLWPSASAVAAGGPMLSIQAIRQAPASVVPAEAGAARDVRVVRDWTGPLCRARVVNEGKASVRINEVVLFDVAHAYPPQTHLYGEGFTMLTETGGTLGKPVNLGYSDSRHYKIPQPADATSATRSISSTPPPSTPPAA